MDKLIQSAQFLLENKRFLGLAVGFVFGLLYLIFGFLQTVAFGLFLIVGYFVGKMLDDREDWRDVLDRIVPPKHRE
ncbi:DUF2273 domain-containing protein [Tumebacillus permanentifrigoris]|uniref:Small integral membrane protein DUF2273 n=1 Tax=Tumebacillus permanentifrigoris TaxID=378543 RepID=A0A316D8A9_9BACL|nr:DUF2273 domain-containing protein [Tumebacillus permanentifrigoris]PWK11509.1 small integral membrane protein DUF2273 [Tumebacillus permanentifrigoris]